MYLAEISKAGETGYTIYISPVRPFLAWQAAWGNMVLAAVRYGWQSPGAQQLGKNYPIIRDVDREFFW